MRTKQRQSDLNLFSKHVDTIGKGRGTKLKIIVVLMGLLVLGFVGFGDIAVDALVQAVGYTAPVDEGYVRVDGGLRGFDHLYPESDWNLISDNLNRLGITNSGNTHLVKHLYDTDATQLGANEANQIISRCLDANDPSKFIDRDGRSAKAIYMNNPNEFDGLVWEREHAGQMKLYKSCVVNGNVYLMSTICQEMSMYMYTIQSSSDVKMRKGELSSKLNKSLLSEIMRYNKNDGQYDNITNCT